TADRGASGPARASSSRGPRAESPDSQSGLLYRSAMDFRSTTVADLAAQITERRLSAREVTAAALDRIDRLDDELGAFVAVDGDSAMAEAASIDERLANGDDVGPLAGIPLAVKDLEDAIGFPTTRGSAAFAGGGPATVDSPLVERL